MVAQLGGGGPQRVDLTALASDGSPVRLAVLRRLLFEHGRPVAVQDAGHPRAHRGARMADVREEETRESRKAASPNN